MKLDELLKMCKSTGDFGSAPGQIRRAVLDMLGEDMPCGFDQPCAVTDQRGVVHIVFDAFDGSPSEARAYAAAILRACDQEAGT